MAGNSSFEARYRRMSDVQLHDMLLDPTLMPAARQALEAEIERRGLGKAITLANEAQAVINDSVRRRALVEIVRNQPCPICGSQETEINAAKISRVISIFIFTFRKRHLRIGCRSCLSKELSNANLITAFLGWWGFPFGPIWSIMALVSNFDRSKDLSWGKPSQDLQTFVSENAGLIMFELEKNPNWTPGESYSAR